MTLIEFACVLAGVVLYVVQWREINRLRDRIESSRTIAEGQRILLCLSALYVRVLNKGVALSEMVDGPGDAVITVTMSEEARDKLYWLTDMLEQYREIVERKPANA